MTPHVKHLGFDLELKVVQIVRALALASDGDRVAVVSSLKPIGLRRAVAEQLGLDAT